MWYSATSPSAPAQHARAHHDALTSPQVLRHLTLCPEPSPQPAVGSTSVVVSSGWRSEWAQWAQSTDNSDGVRRILTHFLRLWDPDAVVGTTRGAVVGTTRGAVAGTTSGAVVGTTSGAVVGTTSGAVVGTTSGAVVGTTSGAVVGTTSGAGSGAVLGTTGGAVVGTTGGASSRISSSSVRDDDDDDGLPCWDAWSYCGQPLEPLSERTRWADVAPLLSFRMTKVRSDCL